MDGNTSQNSGRLHSDAAPPDDLVHAAAKAIEPTRSVRPGSSRAVRLLQRLLDRDLANAEWLAAALSVSSQQLEEYRTGYARLPLCAQRRLAELVLESVPELAREAHRLRLQCRAAEVYQAKETETHMVAPPTRFR